MKKIRKFIVIIRVSLSNALTYKASVISRFCFYTLFIYIFMSLWKAIYKEGSVHGYSYAQIVWYLIMTELIGFICGTEILVSINDEVKTGSIVYQLGRPIHYLMYHFANTLGQVMMNTLAFGLLAALLGLLFVGPLETFSFSGLPFLLLSVILSVILSYFILMLIGLTSFVIEDNFAIFLIYQKISFMLGLFLPVEFLPEWLQRVCKKLPFSYVYWAPSKIFVNYSFELCTELIPRQLFWTGCIAALTFLFYRSCTRRLQVNGG